MKIFWRKWGLEVVVGRVLGDSYSKGEWLECDGILDGVVEFRKVKRIGLGVWCEYRYRGVRECFGSEYLIFDNSIDIE